MCDTITSVKSAVCDEDQAAVYQYGLYVAMTMGHDLAAAGRQHGTIGVTVYRDNHAHHALEILSCRTENHKTCDNPARCTFDYDQLAARLEDPRHSSVLIVAMCETVVPCDHAWMCPSPLNVQP